ncbi:MAG: transcription antitermination factor NusB, partial [candidate division NC10 bacterium]|nr:transcription antitermination factor NusB [candidate division NC10 bacterium]
MGKRRKARELAICLLYQLEFHPGRSAEAMEIFWQEHPHPPQTREFAQSLVMGVREHLDQIDGLIGKLAEHWSFN